MTMLGFTPPQHSRLVLWQHPIPELDPELLLIQFPHLEDPKPGKKGIHMLEPPLTSYQADKSLLQSKESRLQIAKRANFAILCLIWGTETSKELKPRGN